MCLAKKEKEKKKKKKKERTSVCFSWLLRSRNNSISLFHFSEMCTVCSAQHPQPTLRRRQCQQQRQESGDDQFGHGDAGGLQTEIACCLWLSQSTSGRR